MKKIALFVVACMILFPGKVIAQHQAHEHGTAHMNLLVEGQNVEIEIKSPLANLISFEHAPESEQQKQEVKEMAVSLHAVDKLFIFPPEADCGLKELSLNSSVISPELLTVEAAQGEPSEDKAASRDHANIHEKEEVANDHHHDDSADHEHGAHGELDIEATFICQAPEKLNKINIGFFDVFAGLQKIEAQIITQSGQSSYDLTKKSNTIEWRK